MCTRIVTTVLLASALLSASFFGLACGGAEAGLGETSAAETADSNGWQVADIVSGTPGDQAATPGRGGDAPAPPVATDASEQPQDLTEPSPAVLDAVVSPDGGPESDLPLTEDIIETWEDVIEPSEEIVEAPEDVVEPPEDVPLEDVFVAPLCGDGLCEISETCASCSADCPVCRPGAGEVIITEIMQNPQAVSDQYGEWFEVLNVTAEPRSLAGVSLQDAGADAHVIEGPLVIEPGAYAVFAASADLGVGSAADHVWTDFYLGNAADLISLEYGGVVIDAVAYAGDPPWPDPTGASMKLDTSALDATSNDDGAHWCEGVIMYGLGDLGTPGAANLACGEAPPSVCGDGECAEDETCVDCSVDCGFCPCEAGQVPGCLGDCLAQGAPGDGVCQAGLNCLEHGFDGGDCLAPGCGTALFFSEYVEGLSNSKGLEIYNPTGSPVDLSDYAIWKIANGGLWIDDAMVTWLEGSLASDDVHVFCHTGLSPQTPGVCDQASGGNPMNFNGNDALGLVHKGVLIDVIGAEGEDPGAGWMIGEESSATKDHILVRDPAVIAGDPLWQSALSTWTVLGDDATDGLGAHVVTIPCDPSNAPTPVAD